MGDVRGKLPLQIAVLLQLGDLGRELIGHVIKGSGQATHLVIAIDGHTLLEMPGRQTLCNARGGANGSNNLLGGQPRNAY